jgi:hypothetical protein
MLSNIKTEYFKSKVEEINDRHMVLHSSMETKPWTVAMIAHFFVQLMLLVPRRLPALFADMGCLRIRKIGKQ